MRMKGVKDPRGSAEAEVEDVDLGPLDLSRLGSLAALSPGRGATASGWMAWGEHHPAVNLVLVTFQVSCQCWP